MLFQPNQKRPKTTKTPIQSPITTTPKDRTNNQSPLHYPLFPTNPPHPCVGTGKTRVWSCVYGFTVLHCVFYSAPLGITKPHYDVPHDTAIVHKPSNHAVSHVVHIITIHHITQMRTLHKHPTYAPTNIDPTYTHQNIPHEYPTRNTLVFHPNMHRYSTHMCATNTPHPYVGSGETR